MDLSGFLTGVGVTVFCSLIAMFWAKVVRPWWHDRGYGGLRLDGTWNSELPSADGRFIFKMELKQNFHNITGKLYITKTLNAGGSSQSELEVEGVYWESFLQLRGKSCVDNKLSFSVFLLKAESGGKKLWGQYAFRALNNDHVMGYEICFEKLSE